VERRVGALLGVRGGRAAGGPEGRRGVVCPRAGETGASLGRRDACPTGSGADGSEDLGGDAAGLDGVAGALEGFLEGEEGHVAAVLIEALLPGGPEFVVFGAEGLDVGLGGPGEQFGEGDALFPSEVLGVALGGEEGVEARGLPRGEGLERRGFGVTGGEGVHLPKACADRVLRKIPSRIWGVSTDLAEDYSAFASCAVSRTLVRTVPRICARSCPKGRVGGGNRGAQRVAEIASAAALACFRTSSSGSLAAICSMRGSAAAWLACRSRRMAALRI
jgi:hypothetical protein